MNEQESVMQSGTDDQAVGEVNFFSPSSRINRLRYWAHSMLMIIPFYIVLGLGAFLAYKVSPIFWGLVAITYIAMIVFSFILIIQRLHDLDKSGWLSLLILVPFANLYLMVLLIFFAGTPGRNTYGLRTPPNKTWHWVLALAFPVLFFVIGILAAISIPAYQRYVMATQQQVQDVELQDSSATEEEMPASDEASSEPTEDAVDDGAVVEKKETESSASESETPKAPE